MQFELTNLANRLQLELRVCEAEIFDNEEDELQRQGSPTIPKRRMAKLPPINDRPDVISL